MTGCRSSTRATKVSFADFDNPSTRYLRWRLNRRGTSVDIYDIDHDQVPAHFDAAYSFDVIEHVPDAFEFLARLESLASVVAVNLLEPAPTDPDIHHELPIAAVLEHAESAVCCLTRSITAAPTWSSTRAKGRRVSHMAGRNWRKVPWKLGVEKRLIAQSELRKIWVKTTHQHCHVEFQGPVFLGPGFSLHIPDHGTLIVGPAVEFRRGFHCEIWGDGRVEIGGGSVFTYYSLIQCATRITIGERCMFGQSSMIVDGNHRFRDHNIPMLQQGYDYRDINIGNDVTTTTKCTIIADIGERSVIGANSVVTRDILPTAWRWDPRRASLSTSDRRNCALPAFEL